MTIAISNAPQRESESNDMKRIGTLTVGADTPEIRACEGLGLDEAVVRGLSAGLLLGNGVPPEFVTSPVEFRKEGIR